MAQRHNLLHANVGRWIAPAGRLFRAVMLSMVTRRRRAVSFVAKTDGKDLTLLAELVESGTITPVMEQRFTLSQTADAVRRLAVGHTRGKIVINIR